MFKQLLFKYYFSFLKLFRESFGKKWLKQITQLKNMFIIYYLILLAFLKIVPPTELIFLPKLVNHFLNQTKCLTPLVPVQQRARYLCGLHFFCDSTRQEEGTLSEKGLNPSNSYCKNTKSNSEDSQQVCPFQSSSTFSELLAFFRSELTIVAVIIDLQSLGFNCQRVCARAKKRERGVKLTTLISLSLQK